MVFVQCTSPFIDPADLDRGVRLVADGEADSVFAGVETYEFLWRGLLGRGPVELVDGQNHDRSHRPRRQDRIPDYRETGAFYVHGGPGFRAARHRFFGRTAVVPVPPLTAVEIDTLDDVAVAAALAPVLDPMLDPEPLLDVDAVITDFDGVHTDDTASGRPERRGDGPGQPQRRPRAWNDCAAPGCPLLIVSKETNPVVRARAAKLGVEVLHGVEHKAEVVRDWLRSQRHPGRSNRLPRQRHQRSRDRWVWWAGRSPSPTLSRRYERRPGGCSTGPAGTVQFGSCATWCCVADPWPRPAAEPPTGGRPYWCQQAQPAADGLRFSG